MSTFMNIDVLAVEKVHGWNNLPGTYFHDWTLNKNHSKLAEFERR
jgi:hypothetical protein